MTTMLHRLARYNFILNTGYDDYVFLIRSTVAKRAAVIRRLKLVHIKCSTVKHAYTCIP